MEPLSLLLPIIAFIAAAGIVLAIYSAATADRQVLQERLAGYTPAGATMATAGGTGESILRERSFSSIPLVQWLLSGTSFADRMAMDLAAAGVPLRVGEYLLIRWFAAVGLAVLVSAVGLPWIVALAVAVVGFYIPKLYVRRRQQVRVARFNDQLIDALTMLANAMRSGSSFLQAIDLVARELPSPVSDEFGQVVAEVSVGAPVDEALQNLSRRVDSYDLYLIVTAMQVQRQTGGNLAEVLENIAHTIRERLRILRQVEVLTAEQRLSALIVGLMPLIILLILSVVSPGYHGPFLADPLGRVLLGIGFAFQLLGFLVMRRLGKIDV